MASNSELAHILARIPVHGKSKICLPTVVWQILAIITEVLYWVGITWHYDYSGLTY